MKRKRLQSFKEDYSTKYPCIKKSTQGEHYAHCTICSSDFSISASGIFDITRHIGGKKYIKMARLQQANSTVTDFFQSESSTTPLKHKVIGTELLWSRFIVENNIPISVSDHATKLFKVMFPDSGIAMKFSSCRTKTTALLKFGAKTVEDEVVKSVNQKSLALCTDGSNDKKEKFYPIILR